MKSIISDFGRLGNVCRMSVIRVVSGAWLERDKGEVQLPTEVIVIHSPFCLGVALATSVKL